MEYTEWGLGLFGGWVMRGRGRRTRSGGISMIELMFALAILAVALLGIVGVLLQAIGTKDADREQQIAKTAATRQLEVIRTAAQTNYDTVVTTYANTSFDVAGLSNLSNQSKLGLGTVVIDSSNSDLLDLTVAIAWTGIRGDSRYEIRTLLTR